MACLDLQQTIPPGKKPQQGISKNSGADKRTCVDTHTKGERGERETERERERERERESVPSIRI